MFSQAGTAVAATVVAVGFVPPSARDGECCHSLRHCQWLRKPLAPLTSGSATLACGQLLLPIYWNAGKSYEPSRS